MRKSGFYPRLALQNIRKNGKFYLPYQLTAIGCAAMFYIILLLANDPDLQQMYGGRTLQGMLTFGAIVIGLFSTILLFYTNSFLMKRRRRELGLWNILGMEKRHIARVLLLETMIIALCGIIGGLGVGMLLSKLLSLLLYKLLHAPVPFGFVFSAPVCAITAIVFGVIFFLTLLFNLFQIHLARPVELLSSGKAGERQPKTKWFLTVVGVITTLAGYILALTVKEPVSAISFFFIAVLLVIIGTYCLFTSGSIAVLKALRRNKKYYYQTKHFTSISGMLHRMKQNAAGLASICILCCMILVTVSTTVSLYVGLEDILNDQYPNEVSITYSNQNAELEESSLAKVREVLKKHDLKGNAAGYHFFDFFMKCKNDVFSGDPNLFTGMPNVEAFVLIPSEDFRALTGGGKQAEDGRPLIWSSDRQTGKHIKLLDLPFNVQKLDTFPVLGDAGTFLANVHYLVVTEHDMAQISDALKVNGYADSVKMRYEIDVNANGTQKQLKSLSDEIGDAVFGSEYPAGVNISVDSRANARVELGEMYGGFLFLGLFLGALFLMATVLIIYYKQISEGYDDKERFAIMQKVGLSRAEIKSTIRSQVLTVFFLPIGIAMIHICGSFKMISKLLNLFNLTNISLFIGCTAATVCVFCVIYSAVYALTARTYYKIVS